MFENTEIYFLLASLTFGVGLFVGLHLRPLRENEIISLSNKRRKKDIRKYFNFDKRPYFVGSTIKSTMRSNGKIYNSEKKLYEFPSFVAGMLKYKKHEWIIVAFEKNKLVLKYWLNKGINKTQVDLLLHKEDIADLAKEHSCDSILIFHNHPNTNPNYYNCTKPSDRDRQSAIEFSKLFNQRGYNLIEFICERGIHYEYFLSATDKFLPCGNYIQNIESINGKSKFRNLLLHFERML